MALLWLADVRSTFSKLKLISLSSSRFRGNKNSIPSEYQSVPIVIFDKHYRTTQELSRPLLYDLIQHKIGHVIEKKGKDSVDRCHATVKLIKYDKHQHHTQLAKKNTQVIELTVGSRFGKTIQLSAGSNSIRDSIDQVSHKLSHALVKMKNKNRGMSEIILAKELENADQVAIQLESEEATYSSSETDSIDNYFCKSALPPITNTRQLVHTFLLSENIQAIRSTPTPTTSRAYYEVLTHKKDFVSNPQTSVTEQELVYKEQELVCVRKDPVTGKLLVVTPYNCRML